MRTARQAMTIEGCKIFLHIGTEKTGSTSIQKFMADSAGKLDSLGVVYPDKFGGSNHIDLTIYAANPERTTNLRASPHARKMRRNSVYENFESYFSHTMNSEYRCENRTVIFSNEHLSSRLVVREELESLKKLLESISKDITVILYLRPQEVFLTSLYSSAIRNGHTVPFDLWIGRQYDKPHLHYSRLIDMWSNVFGRDKIRVRSFEAAVNGRGLIEDFISACEIPAFGHARHKAARNRSLSKTTLRFLRLVNSLLVSARISKVSYFSKALRKIILMVPIGREKPTIADSQREMIRVHYGQDLARLQKEYDISL
jgi:hypothetical protein